MNILTDPWYEGDAFHKGWNLLFENDPKLIKKTLTRVTHIWLSHEHPDHFSIKFFRDFGDIIRQNNIRILFQATYDKRVVKFLYSQNFEVLSEIQSTVKPQWICQINLYKRCFYDSGLLIQNNYEKILNLNDCEVNTEERAQEVKEITGEVDILLTQFSFAAWKGGKENKKWRQDASREKLETIKLQLKTFNPKYLIPFASFIYFSHEKNAYLNDAINRPNDVIEKFQNGNSKIIFLKPLQIFDNTYCEETRNAALKFWNSRYDKIGSFKKNNFLRSRK